MSVTTHGNPIFIKKKCEWTGEEFTVDWKHRNQRFVNKRAMYAWRKSQTHETVKCMRCETPFERRKFAKHHRTGMPKQYCSQSCAMKSDAHRIKAREWTIKNNPMYSDASRQKISKTKLHRYGNKKYNNYNKAKETCIEKYGVSTYLHHPEFIKSNGKRISKFQRLTYEKILVNHPDAMLEKYLTDVRCAVDIYIPSIKKVIECYGDYWHCNPSKCAPNYYNKSLHATATEIWKKDSQKIKRLQDGGYVTEVLWENSTKRFKH